MLLGLLLLAGVNPTLANLTQAILYTLTTRLGAPGRDRYLLLLTLGIGLLGGWLTVATGGIAAAFLGHVITRFAFFLCTGHTGQTKPRAREPEEIEKRRRPPEGWRIIGSRESRFQGSLIVGRVAAPVALYLHIPFCVSLCPYCDFVVLAGAAARGPKARIDAFLAALARRARSPRRRARRCVPGQAPAARVGLPRGWHAVAPAGGGDRRVARPGPRPVRHRRRRGDHRGGEPRPR